MNGLLLSAQVESVATRKDRTVKIVIGTQELSPAKAGELVGFANKLVCVYVSQKEVMTQAEMDQVDQIDPEFPGKTQSQRLRNVLFVLWQKVPEGFTDFDVFYKHQTEKIIDHFKTKIPA